MSVKVKICGITNRDDALTAVEAGADALGFVFYEPSPRQIDWGNAAAIISQLPPFVAKVGVFVNSSRDSILQIIARCRLDTVQLHGSEAPGFCRDWPVPVIKAFRIESEAMLLSLPNYDTAAWLLDSYVAGQMGGTGATFNWELACQAKQYKRPIILAGGLTSSNVAAAVQRVQPFAVDVSSGVEAKPGRKDHAQVRAFIKAAKGALEGDL